MYTNFLIKNPFAEIYGSSSHLALLAGVLSQVPVATAPLFHFTCSPKMRKGLAAMCGGYESIPEYRSSQGLRKRAPSAAKSNTNSKDIKKSIAKQ